MREYIVTCKTKEDLESLYEDMETPGGSLYIPDREVELVHRRPISRNTHYMLSEEEAAEISNDERVLAVGLTLEERGATIKPMYVIEGDDSGEDPESKEGFDSQYTLTTNYWSKSANNNNQFRQWGMYRMRNQQTVNNWGINPGTQSIGGTVQFTSTGRNVDVVIVDGCIDPAHPEMQVNENGTGGTRVEQFNWFSLNSQVTGGSAGTYLYTNGGNGDYTTGGQQQNDNNHGMHVAGTACGNRLGWAREATVYNINPYGTAPSSVSTAFLVDYIRVWHNQKDVNPETGKKNPTVTNHSYGAFVDVNISSVNQVVYRGTTYNNPNAATCTNLGLINNGTQILDLPVWDTAMQADIDDAINDGILFIGAAGNSDFMMDVEGGVNYNNTISYSGGNAEYYNRGALPTALGGVICVGAIDSTVDEQKADFSNSGPRVDVYAPGVQILSSVLSGGVTDSRNTSYRVQKKPGTSMASPNVAGVVACICEHYPRMTQFELQTYMNAHGGNPPSNNHLCTLNQIVNGGGDSLNYSVTNSGNNYVFSGDATGTQPDLTVTEGDVLNFSLNVASNHPFYIVTALGGNNTTNEVNEGILTVGASRTSGDMIWDTTGVTPGTYYYVCDVHGGMNGEINVQYDTSNRSLHGSKNQYARMPKIRKVPNPAGATYVGAETTQQQTWPRLDNKFRPIMDGGNIDPDIHPTYMAYPRHPIWSRKLS